MQFQDCNNKADEKKNRKEEAVMKWHTQAGNIATNIKVKIDFTLPELSAEKIVACNFHVDNSAKGRYDMIIGRYILTDLGLNI